MKITAELDNLHLEKLKNLEKKFQKNTSELISFAIDEVYGKQLSVELNEGQKAYQIMQKSGFIGSIEGGGNSSETYKDHLNWYHKL
jgi:vacuolar-type H+-ATPase subunit E/Vma4